VSGAPVVRLSGWGRSRVVPGVEVRSEDLEEATRDAALTRGLGRSYGDASLPPRAGARVASSLLADRVLAFDAGTGVLRAEAGLSLAELNRLLLRRGWFTPVSPGTQFVTLGGMVAADVHGKNHHRDGSLGAHVRRLRLRAGSGELVWCGGSENPELFRATLGGMGLTGHILEVELQMRAVPSPWIRQELERARDLDSLLARLREAGARWPYTVAWVDCFARGRAFGRGVVTAGRWAEPGEAPGRPPPEKHRLSLPLDLPGWALNRWTGAAFYGAFYRIQRQGSRIVHPEAFFYPLDALLHWNRLYGRRGFTQYQCVLPDTGDPGPARRVFELLAGLGVRPFLAVVKDFGAEGHGLLSFPRPGFTLALDFPVVEGRTQRVVDHLNECVLAHGGRVYLAKDAFSRPEHFRAMEPRLGEWSRIRDKWDPERRLRSALSVRLLGDEP